MSPRDRQVGAYRKCCQTIIRNVRNALVEEKSNRKARVSPEKAWERIIKYTGIARGALRHVLQDELLEPGDRIQRVRPQSMPFEDELRMRPAICRMVMSRQHVILDNLVICPQAEEGGWRWSRSCLRAALVRIGFTFSKGRTFYEKMGGSV